jgi:hypothetical protein
VGFAEALSVVADRANAAVGSRVRTVAIKSLRISVSWIVDLRLTIGKQSVV